MSEVGDKNQNAECCICYEQAYIPYVGANALVRCRNGTGCTAVLCCDCLAQLYNRTQDNCPICRRLFFKPNFIKQYDGGAIDHNKRWVFKVGAVEVQILMLRDTKIQGEAYVTNAPLDVSRKYCDAELLEKYAYEIPHLLEDIKDNDSISIIGYSGQSVDLTADVDYIALQLNKMNVPCGSTETLSGTAVKAIIKKGFWY
tara:strand:- start:107 stop:706 length:600 start_codon:yes stop_codon:yes gene_type:complete